MIIQYGQNVKKQLMLLAGIFHQWSIDFYCNITGDQWNLLYKRVNVRGAFHENELKRFQVELSGLPQPEIDVMNLKGIEIQIVEKVQMLPGRGCYFFPLRGAVLKQLSVDCELDQEKMYYPVFYPHQNLMVLFTEFGEEVWRTLNFQEEIFARWMKQDLYPSLKLFKLLYKPLEHTWHGNTLLARWYHTMTDCGGLECLKNLEIDLALFGRHGYEEWMDCWACYFAETLSVIARQRAGNITLYYRSFGGSYYPEIDLHLESIGKAWRPFADIPYRNLMEMAQGIRKVIEAETALFSYLQNSID
ncbi:MAG: hypothetical protein GY710_23200 [Desulfobacteraceae bacterium]|nr:hypothetical protein [Desulfobacteraceae bacterium]